MTRRASIMTSYRHRQNRRPDLQRSGKLEIERFTASGLVTRTVWPSSPLFGVRLVCRRAVKVEGARASRRRRRGRPPGVATRENDE